MKVVVKVSNVEKLLAKLFKTKKIAILKSIFNNGGRSIFNSYDVSIMLKAVIKVYHQHASHMI